MANKVSRKDIQTSLTIWEVEIKTTVRTIRMGLIGLCPLGGCHQNKTNLPNPESSSVSKIEEIGILVHCW